MNTLKKMSKSGLVKSVFCLLGLFAVAAASTGCDDRPPQTQTQSSEYQYYWIDPVTGDIWFF